MVVVLTNENNPFTLKLLIAANFTKKEINLKIVNLKDAEIPEPKHLPCLIEEDRNLFITNAGAYLLYPPDTSDNNIIEEWLEWESTVLVPKLISNLVSGKASKSNLNSCLRVLNDFIGAQSEGEAIKVSDVVIWSTLYPLYKDPALSNEYLRELNHLHTWLQRLETKPQFETALARYIVKPGTSPYQVLQNSAKYFIIDDVVVSPQHSVVESAVMPEELYFVKEAWLNGLARIPDARKETFPILPIKGEKNVLITSALPYVNNVPHLGNIIGCVLSADVFARFSRLCNYNTLYICGTDEYGTATETKALEEGLTPQQICDKYFEVHNSIYRWFNIGFDYFGRTTTPEQTKITQEIFLDLNRNGFTQTQAVEQLLCEKCNRFLADRFVEGGCPHVGCNYEDARGDQCDGCGKLVNATELKNPRCKVCGTAPVVRQSSQFFLDLPQLEPLVRHWMDKSCVNWSNNARIIAKSWMKEGLKPRCITRDLKWGVPVPVDGFRDKVFYVWFDAPIGYLSITARYCKEWQEWWKPKADTHISLYQFMAKDNVPFHSVMFPAVLLGLNQGFTTVSHLMASEYLNYEDGKFSKSRGIGVFGNDAQNTGIASDVWRFYLLYVRPESQDSSFSWSDLATKNNSELLNNLGNFVNRAQVFAQKFFNGILPKMVLNDDDYILLALCTRELKQYIKALEKAKLRDGIRHILAISKHGNQYMQASEPWVLIKGTDEERERAGTIIGICCNITHLLATLLFPYLPDTSRTLREQLNVFGSLPVLTPENPEIVTHLPEGHILGKPSPLFSKIEADRVEELKQKFAGKQNVEGQEKTVEKKVAKEVPVVTQVNGVADPKDIKKLQESIDAQAIVVRNLKSSGAAKADWQPQVNILLELKSKLTIATGEAPNKPATGKKGKK